MWSPWAVETRAEAQGAGSWDLCAWTCVYMCARCHLNSIPLDKPEPGGSASQCVLGSPGLCTVGPSGNMGKACRAEPA